MLPADDHRLARDREKQSDRLHVAFPWGVSRSRITPISHWSSGMPPLAIASALV